MATSQFLAHNRCGWEPYLEPDGIQLRLQCHLRMFPDQRGQDSVLAGDRFA